MIRGEREKSHWFIVPAKRLFAGFLFACVLVAAGYSGFAQVSAAVSPPRILMYQGRLLNSNNVPVSDATASMSFALYTAVSGGTCLWSNNDSACSVPIVSRTVTLTAGLFSESLGDTTLAAPYAAIPASVFSDNGNVFLEVVVNGETLAPRKQMFAAPYAMNSDVLDGYDTSTTGATTSVVPVTNTFGNLTITGDPQGAPVNQGSLYVNPAGAAVLANETLVGVAVGGALRMTLDAEGDQILSGDIGVNGGDITSSSATFNFLDNTSDALTIDIGGVNTNLGNTINIATNNATADTLTIGNNNAATTMILTGGTSWSIGTTGLMTTSNDIAVNGGDITTTSVNATLWNANATTVTAFGAATILDLNNAALTSTINIGGVSNNGANTVNIATNNTSADAVVVGNSHASTTVALTGGTSWSVGTTGLITTSNDVVINGGDITSSSGAFNFLDGSGDSAAIDIGGVTTNLGNTVNIATNNATADLINIGNNNASTFVSLVGGTSWSVATSGLITTSSDIAVNGGDITSSAGTFNILDGTGDAPIIEIGGATTNIGNTINIATNGVTADTIAIGNTNGTTTLALTGGTSWSVATSGKIVTSNDISVDGGDITSSSGAFNFLDAVGNASTIDIGGVTTDLGNSINIATNNITSDTLVVGNNNASTTMNLIGGTSWSIATTGLITTSNDAAINGGDLTSTNSAFNLLNTNVTTLTMAGAATVIDFNNAAVTSTINIGGTSQNGANTINIATNGTTADAVNIGNANAATTMAVTGGTAWSIATTGNITTAGDVAINGNDLTSTGILRVASGGAAAISLDSASGLVYVAASDDFAVGGTSLVAPFSVDESLNEVRIGDGANDANDPGISMYASDAVNSGKLSFADTDTFAFSGGKITEDYSYNLSTIGTGGFNMVTSTATVSGTSGAGVNQTVVASNGTVTFSGALGGGSGSTMIGISGATNLAASSAVLTQGVGVYGSVYNQSTNAAAVNGTGYLAGGDFSVFHDSTQTISLAYGAYGSLTAGQGTITTGVAVNGEIKSGGGAFTTGYGGQFTNTTEGSTRYGVFGEASGGATNNFAGYFASARLQVDTDKTPDVPGTANGAGDIYISDDIEADGRARFGDSSGNDDFTFTSAMTNQLVMQVLADSLTSGTGIKVQRANDGGAGAFSGRLIDVQMLDVTSSTGVGIGVQNEVAGNSAAAYFTQTNVANQTDAAGGTTVGGQALILETSEAASNDDIMLIRSNGQVVLAIETDGSILSDNAYSAAGADYAEYFPSTDATLTSYEMVCIDSARPLSVKRCQAGETDPFGVISSDPGFIGNLPSVGETGNVLVGMVGQIDTQVNANEAPIAIGDPITTSSLSAGFGAKAVGPARIIGYALEPLSTGTGVIKVLVQPQWYAGNVLTRDGGATKVAGSLAIAAVTSATSANTAVNSSDLQFRGSVWSGGAATTRAMSLQTTVTAANEYRLSVKNNAGLEVASVNQSGDLALAGKFYPSDRGATQGSAYIYFDGSAGIGGSFMRTNASGWATGSYDFAEMFPSPDALRPGEVVVFGDASQQVKRSTGETYSRAIAGIVSTRPGFLAGENRAGTYPIALAGRVPTFVSTENGEIRIGDPLTTSSTPGYAMRATEAGPIIGYASEAFSGTTGSIVVFVNASYYAGTPVEEGPATENSVSRLAQDIENFDTTGVLNLNGGQLLAIGSMSSASGAWHLDTNGDIVTSGRLIELVESSTGAKIETYAATSREMTVQLSGTVELDHGRATVRFSDIDPAFTSIIDENPSYRALVTPYGATGLLYVTNRTVEGFEIVESGDATSGVDVDWIVIAYRRDYAPVVGTDAVVTPTFSEPIAEVMTDAGEAASVEVVANPAVSEDPLVEVPEETPVEEVIPEPVVEVSVSEPVVAPDPGDGSTGASEAPTP